MVHEVYLHSSMQMKTGGRFNGILNGKLSEKVMFSPRNEVRHIPRLFIRKNRIYHHNDRTEKIKYRSRYIAHFSSVMTQNIDRIVNKISDICDRS